jgi:hypothetical protein
LKAKEAKRVLEIMRKMEKLEEVRMNPLESGNLEVPTGIREMALWPSAPDGISTICHFSNGDRSETV